VSLDLLARAFSKLAHHARSLASHRQHNVVLDRIRDLKTSLCFLMPMLSRRPIAVMLRSKLLPRRRKRGNGTPVTGMISDGHADVYDHMEASSTRSRSSSLPAYRPPPRCHDARIRFRRRCDQN